MDVTFMPLPIQLACPVPVTPDGRTVDESGEALPMEERTDRCAVWAHWMIGGQVSCDCHTKIFCDVAGIDFAELVEDAGRNLGDALEPWDLRRRSTQEDAALTDKISAEAYERPTGRGLPNA